MRKLKKRMRGLVFSCVIFIFYALLCGCVAQTPSEPVTWPENTLCTAVPSFLYTPDKVEEFLTDENGNALRNPWVQLTFKNVKYEEFQQYAGQYEVHGFGVNTLPENSCKIAVYFGFTKTLNVRLSYYQSDNSMILRIYTR